MAKCCPLCDQPIEGNFCKGCFRFVKPVEIKSGAKINVGHDLENDDNCDYHGTTEEFHEEYASDAEHYSYHEKEGFTPHEDYQNVADSEEDYDRIVSNDYVGDFTTKGNYGASVNNSAASSSTRTYNYPRTFETTRAKVYKSDQKAGAIGAVIFIAAIVIVIFAFKFVTEDMLGGYKEYEYDEVVVAETAFELSDDEYAAMCVKLGYDEYGYKALTHSEAVDTGLQDTPWYPMNMSMKQYRTSVLSILKKNGIDPKIMALEEYDENLYLDRDGSEVALFYVEDSYYLVDDYTYMVIVGNSITGDMLYAYSILTDEEDILDVTMAMLEAGGYVSENVEDDRGYLKNITDMSNYSDDSGYYYDVGRFGDCYVSSAYDEDYGSFIVYVYAW
ncbi:MAG: hypothetical protein K6F92_05825 [Lachnospiraceae bacterium]|nr:hypothetical protein [Lachnospiraceae bacterium]